MRWYAERRGETLRIRLREASRQADQTSEGVAVDKALLSTSPTASGTSTALPGMTAELPGMITMLPDVITAPFGRAFSQKRPAFMTTGLVSAPRAVELALTASRGFSVFALWPDAEPYLTEREWRGLSALVTRVRCSRALL